MRYIGWKITVLTIALLTLRHVAFAADNLSGWTNITKSNTKNYSNGQRTSTTDTLSQNYYLKFQKPVTSMISYQLNVRSRLSNEDKTDSSGETTSRYQRTVEPDILFSLRNPTYTLDTGYRRRETWKSKQLKNDARTTNEYYYSHFVMSPQSLPSLFLRFDRQNEYDHLNPREKDRTNTSYFVNSDYFIPSRFFKFKANASYLHNIDETPQNTISKTIIDSINGNYNIGYGMYLWNGRSTLSFSYQGNYLQNKTRQSISETGDVLFKRTTLGGFYGLGTALDPDVDILTSQVLLSDNNHSTGISTINIGTDTFHNIGIWVSSDKPVDRIYIYVDKDISTDANLIDPANWKIYRSDFNQPGTWTEISVSGVSTAVFDVLNDIYRYEIEFSDPQDASYFKAVNMEAVSALGITDVLVTEIEAYGIDAVPDTGKVTTDFTFFTQELSATSIINPIEKLSFTFTYHIDKSDINPDSAFNSVSNLFSYVLSKPSSDEGEDFTSDIRRSYSARTDWIIHRKLTSSVGFYRGERFDNRNETDASSNTYTMSLGYTPLHTLKANLSAYRTDRYNFDFKETTDTTVLLSIISKLYRNLNMVNDISYTNAESFISETEFTTYTLNGNINARFTRRFSSRLGYVFTENTTEGISRRTMSGDLRMTYRPFRFINITSRFKITEDDGDITHSEDLYINWRPLPAVSMNVRYRHKDPAGPSSSDSISTTWKWHITKFMSSQFRYSYSQTTQDNKTEKHNLNANLNVRF